MCEKLDFLYLPSENLVQILPESGSALDSDPDPHSYKMLDPYPDPHTTNADPKHCLPDTGTDFRKDNEASYF
jgi:hypothetical protein